MSIKTKRRLSRFANGLEAVVVTSIKGFASAVELILIDFAFGKGKFRKRGSKMRPIIHRTYNRTIIYRASVPSERLHVVKSK
jgi:hypothetical protein